MDGEARRGGGYAAHSPCGRSPAPSSRGSLGPDDLASLGMQGRHDMSIMSRASFSSNRTGNDRARRTTGHGHSRDPRPVGERAYTQQCAKMVEEFLESRGYPLDVTRRLQSSNVISSREYYDIFKYLASVRDETMKLEGSMDVEIPAAMKKWKFPFELKKSKLQNIGAPGSWPELIAILAWVVEFIEADQPLNSLAFDRCTDFGEDEFADENPAGQEAVPSTEKQAAYVEFLNGKDREEIQAGWLQKIANEVEELEGATVDAERRYHEKEEELAALDKRHEELPLLEEQRQRHMVAAETLEHEISKVEVKTQGVQERIKQLETEARNLETENAAHEAEVSDLRRQVQEQPMTIAEVEHMKLEWNRKREADTTLKKDVERLDVQIRDIACQETTLEDEIRRLVQTFNELLWEAKIGQPEDKRAEGLELSLRPDLTGPIEKLHNVDWNRSRRHLAKVTQHLDEKGRQTEREIQESQIEQKRTSERTSEAERSNEKKRRHVEQQRRNNQEVRERQAREIAVLGQKAANAEDHLHSIKSSSPVKPLDDSEIEYLQKELVSIKRWSQEESEKIGAQLQKEVKTACNLQFTAKRELMETLASMKKMEQDLLSRMALQPRTLGGA